MERHSAIIDVVLPRMNGIDLAILLTARYPACRLLLFSGQWITTELLAEAATKGHKFDILMKPVHPDVILETAEKLLVPKQSEHPQVAVGVEELREEKADPLSEA